ncbi:sugar-specific transcriptional regulator TrmB [Halalkalicoccus paucihalophilus]|uniref:Sugar-specific transcriptional regulator TrmB n=2 Tax=Halalkalicoccus paucihalophilus TaxID=1008153 RepID=A0A151AHE7_9EURY|nr:helix-turn-helix domain-containing protein [Halalkalicoccus paucihalophilus]KYH26970.1 sugar-specific transcriptional regulator TrmB [Halalkalicoccus paucihalophilus]
MAESDADLHGLMLMDEPGFEHVMQCVFGIQDHECRTYVELLDVPGSTVSELAEDLDRDRSNVNRSLATLMEKRLVERERRLLDSGGYVYQYTAVPLPEAKERMHEALEEWSERVHGRIDGFGTGSNEAF